MCALMMVTTGHIMSGPRVANAAKATTNDTLHLWTAAPIASGFSARFAKWKSRLI